MKHFFVYKYEWEDGMVYIGRSCSYSNRFNNPECYKPNKLLYEAMMTKPYKAEIIFESNNIWEVGECEYNSIKSYSRKYNKASESNWQQHIKGYIKQYMNKWAELGWDLVEAVIYI